MNGAVHLEAAAQEFLLCAVEGRCCRAPTHEAHNLARCPDEVGAAEILCPVLRRRGAVYQVGDCIAVKKGRVVERELRA